MLNVSQPSPRFVSPSPRQPPSSQNFSIFSVIIHTMLKRHGGSYAQEPLLFCR